MDNQFQLRIAYGSGPLEDFNVCGLTLITILEAYQSTGTDISIPPQRSGLDYIDPFCYTWCANNKIAPPTVPALSTTGVLATD